MSADLVPLDPDSRVPAQIEADAESARRFAQAARSDATLRAYRSDWADFAEWCESRQLAAMPARPETVALYIASRAEAGPDDERGRPTAPLKVATLERRMAAVSQAHKLAGVESPALRSREPLHSVWAGVTRTLGTARSKVAPALAADVVAMAGQCDEAVRLAEAFPDEAKPGAALRARRDKAVLLVGFAAALRRSELAVVRTEHVSYTPEGLRLLIPRSKSDQQGAGQVVGVAYGSRPETCPVRAARSYVAAAGRALADQGRPSPLSGAVFRSVDRWGRLGHKAITGRTVANVVKHYAQAAGLDPALYAGHSLRAGFATTAARAGKPDRAIQKQTRHKSAAMLAEYVREGRLFDDNASEGIGL
ncbi:site-specific integrase [Rubrivirga sp. S365]|uniref:site-specific integrase n=1 Tax=Rubrivirga sp. S365 TaxID=3076080 RepID=UPI0028C95C3D|nr:site-specific integrase [Rubrivirga sp. S365]MDT7858331.1 site-specific integrase [Rubrivirga sp. S365]